VPGTAKREFVAILVELRGHQVEFVVVGGVEGVPGNTFDLDIVHSREPDTPPARCAGVAGGDLPDAAGTALEA
jgi:hypothetical protein